MVDDAGVARSYLSPGARRTHPIQDGRPTPRSTRPTVAVPGRARQAARPQARQGLGTVHALGPPERKDMSKEIRLPIDSIKAMPHATRLELAVILRDLADAVSERE